MVSQQIGDEGDKWRWGSFGSVRLASVAFVRYICFKSGSICSLEKHC